MPMNNPANARCLHLLSQLLLNGGGRSLLRKGEGLSLAGWNGVDLAHLHSLANQNHVLVRMLEKLGAESELPPQLAEWREAALRQERQRIARAVSVLDAVCRQLGRAGCHAVVIKSLDHWPDLGSDLDLYTAGGETCVIDVMTEQFGAAVLPRSWGDRLARKWNFLLPGLDEPLEVHVGCLGQAGEHLELARRVASRAQHRHVGGFRFLVPAPEERICIATLQRMYRHFYFRLCDILDTALLLRDGALDFSTLRAAAETSGIWPGVADFLSLVALTAGLHGTPLPLPPDVTASARCRSPLEVRGPFLRVPIMPQAAGLFLRQTVHACQHTNFRALGRLSLVPPLAVAATVAYKLTGSDKGIW